MFAWTHLNVTLYVNCLSCYPLSRLQISNSRFKICDIGRTDTKWDASMKSSVVRHHVYIIHIYDSTWLTDYSALSLAETAALASLSIKNTSLFISAFGFHFILSLRFPLSFGTPAVSSSSVSRGCWERETGQRMRPTIWLRTLTFWSSRLPAFRENAQPLTPNPSPICSIPCRL